MSNCAWCNADPDGSDSHGICQGCSDEIEIQSVWRQLQRTPSYIEQNAADFAEECDEALQNQAVVA